MRGWLHLPGRQTWHLVERLDATLCGLALSADDVRKAPIVIGYTPTGRRCAKCERTAQAWGVLDLSGGR